MMSKTVPARPTTAIRTKAAAALGMTAMRARAATATVSDRMSVRDRWLAADQEGGDETGEERAGTEGGVQVAGPARTQVEEGESQDDAEEVE